MGKYARIANGVVVEVVDLGDVQPRDAFHPDIAKTLVACGEGVVAGCVFAGGKFAAPAPLEVAEQRAEGEALIDLQRGVILTLVADPAAMFDLASIKKAVAAAVKDGTATHASILKLATAYLEGRA